MKHKKLILQIWQQCNKGKVHYTSEFKPISQPIQKMSRPALSWRKIVWEQRIVTWFKYTNSGWINWKIHAQLWETKHNYFKNSHQWGVHTVNVVTICHSISEVHLFSLYNLQRHVLNWGCIKALGLPLISLCTMWFWCK